jgi:hypothetical protein
MRRLPIVAILGVLLIAAMLPAAEAQTGTTVEFLNPSDYQSSITLSNKPDADSTVHLVAWVKSVPTDPFVEFEIENVTTLGSDTLDGTRINEDTWEGHLDISSLADGTYTLTARIYSGNTQMDDVTQQVTVRRMDNIPPPSPNTAEITYPDNGDSFGINTPKGKRANGLIDVTVSEGTQQVRGFYTTTAPGNNPEWISCGFGVVQEDETARVRCTLAEGTAGSSVTAIAVTANDTPDPAEPAALADATGDAHRVSPYAQDARSMEITPAQVSMAATGSCQKFTAQLLDQNGRPMAASNIDIHAVGPDDQIRFGVIVEDNLPVTDPFQAPNSNHVATPRPSIDCTEKDNSGTQGDHNIPNQDDPQHIESTAGTDNAGEFVFALYSNTNGGTVATAWADENDDDAQQASETSAGTRIGWGEAPPGLTREVFLDPETAAATTGSCQRVEVIGKLSGSPMSGQNIDIHISGPDETVNFCLPADGDTGTAPNAGPHTGNVDDATTKHLEGTLDSDGRFVFGVTSASDGNTALTVWADTLEDDIQGTDEASETGTVGWATSGERTISIQSSKSRQQTGRNVRISGRISGATACEASQVVQLKSKRVRGGRFHTIGTATTDSEGDYSFRVTVRASRKYKTVAPAADPCALATSRIITVKAV